MSLDPYEELGVDKTACPDDIKKAHRKAVRAHHPDAGGDPEKFGAIPAELRGSLRPRPARAL